MSASPSPAISPQCRRCGVPIVASDRFCWNCGAQIWEADRTLVEVNRPVEPGVHATDVLSLLLLAAGAFVGGSAVAVLWKSRTGNPLPEPLANPLRAGLALSGAVVVLGLVYLTIIAFRSRRRR